MLESEIILYFRLETCQFWQFEWVLFHLRKQWAFVIKYYPDRFIVTSAKENINTLQEQEWNP
jgi:hypothetical protein